METRQPDVWAAALVTYFAALVAFLLKIWAKRMIGVTFHWGDVISLLAFLGTTAYTILAIYNLGLPDDEASFDAITRNFFRLLWVDMWLYTAAIGLSKLTAVALFWRIFRQSNIKVPILVLSACIVAWIIARIIVISLLCIPISKFWDSEREGHCGVPTNVFFFASTIPHLVMEATIVVLPCLQIRQLNLPKAQKIAVGGMFASGTVVCVASLYQLIKAIELNTSSRDLWWTSTPQAIAAIVEINLGHFSTSLPNLRPILDIVTGRKSISGMRASPPYGHSSTPRSATLKKQQDVFSNRRREGQPQNDSELELAQYEGPMHPERTWKSTSMDVQSSERNSV